MKTLTRVQNNAGCQIDPLVPSIQTVGTKTKGFIYADNNQPNTAWTIKSDYVGDSTEIVINDASVFERIDMKAILGKLQNLKHKTERLLYNTNISLENEDPEKQLIFNILYDTAARRTAVSSLKVEQFSEELSIFTNVKEKGGKRVDLALSDYTVKIIKKYIEDNNLEKNNYLIYSRNNKNKRCISSIVSTILIFKLDMYM